MLKLMDMLKLLVGSKGWDYGVVWRISEDQRFLECISCCCAGAENGDFNDPNGLMFSEFLCKDDVVKHQWNKCCELLSQLPSSVPLDSGIYAEAFFSGQPRWLHSSITDIEQNKSDNEVSTSTRVLIPVLGRLVELFVSKQVSEDQNVVDYIISQSVAPLDLDDDALIEKNTNVEMEMTSLGFEKDLPSGSSYQMNCAIPSQNAGRSDSISDGSDPVDDDNDVKSLKTNGKGQAKNLEAERKRRKKLNERLYKLRALVPIISKLDKAHILVDAIEYVKQLRKQEQELKEELEQDSDNDPDELGNHFHQNVQNPLVQRSYSVDIDRESVQQMEAQVDVTVVDRSKFVVRVFCEQKAGGFVRLLDALNSLGLEVVNVNVTSCRMLVTNVFQVEMKSESNQVVADELKNSLLELTRIPSGARLSTPDEMGNKSENGFGIGYHYDGQHHFFNDVHGSLFQFHN